MSGRTGVLVAALALAGCMGSPAMTTRAPAPRACPAVAPEQRGGRVTWLHPIGEGDHRRLEAWCAAVGPAVVDSVPSGAFGPFLPLDTPTVAAWNTDAGSGHLVAFLQDELGVVCDRSRSTLAPDASHFALLIQEALRRSDQIPRVERSWTTPPPVAEEDHPGDRVDVIEVARACGLSLFYAPAARNGVDPRDGLYEDKGNAIVSTLPLSRFAVLELPYDAARRVVPVATVEPLPGWPLRLASVHLITTPHPSASS